MQKKAKVNNGISVESNLKDEPEPELNMDTLMTLDEVGEVDDDEIEKMMSNLPPVEEEEKQVGEKKSTDGEKKSTDGEKKSTDENTKENDKPTPGEEETSEERKQTIPVLQ